MKNIENKNMIMVLMVVLFLVVNCSMPPAADYFILTTETPDEKNDVTFTLLPSTYTSTATITQTISPTLSPTQVVEIVRGLYANNGGCELPCLLGMVPGQTSIQDVYNQFSQIGYFEDQTRAIDTFQNIAFSTSIPPNELVGTLNDNRWGFSMRVKNDTIVGLVAGATGIKDFSTISLSKFLADFGKPEEIWIDIIPAQSGDPDYAIALYYPSKGISISWRGRVNSIVSENEMGITVIVCPQYIPTQADTAIGLYPPFFYLFSPNEKTPFDEIIVQHLASDPSYKLLNQFDLDKFYTQYLDSNMTSCFNFSYP